MDNVNHIIKVEGGYKLTNFNAQSIEIYKSYDDAKSACRADDEAWKNAKDASEADENSPVDWE